MYKSISFLRQLKGAPLSIYIALVMANQPVSLEWLSQVTGYSDKPTTAALAYLHELGVSDRISLKGGFFLQKNLFQLPLNNDRNFSDDISTTATASIGRKKELCSAEAAAIENDRNFSDDSRHEALAYLTSYSIGEPKLSQIMNDPLITDRDIKLHVERAKEEGIKPGLLIHRLLNHDPIFPKYYIDTTD